MGNEQSSPPAPPPPTIIEDPYPKNLGADGISLSQAVKCGDCQLNVDTNISVSSVTLKRELGDISKEQCDRNRRDYKLVQDKFMSLSDFIANARAGEYGDKVSEQKITLPGGGQRTQEYCQMFSISDEDANKATKIEDLDGKGIPGRIRKISGSGGFSSGTKARFIPSIPFKMAFAGTKVTVDEKGVRQYTPFKSDFTVSQLVLYHPSPIRVDGVQADAILSLNDPTDPAAPAIILIPLRGTNSTDDSASFLNKLTQTLPSVGSYNEKTGTYPESTIQTGSDWSLSRLFTLDKATGTGGTSSVKNGFFTWTGVSEYDRVETKTGNTIRYSWKPRDGLSTPQYFLLDSPLEVNRSDLALITSSLDPTPPTDAIHPIPAQTDLVFHKGSVPPAPETISGGSACGGFLNLCEGFTTGSLNSQLNATNTFEASCPGAKCDPFLQNANRPVDMSGTTFLMGMLFQAFVVIAMAVGAYIALSMVGKDYDLKLREFAEKMGMVIATWIGKRKAAISGAMGLLKKPSLGSLGGIAGLGGLTKGSTEKAESTPEAEAPAPAPEPAPEPEAPASGAARNRTRRARKHQ